MKLAVIVLIALFCNYSHGGNFLNDHYNNSDQCNGSCRLKIKNVVVEPVESISLTSCNSCNSLTSCNSCKEINNSCEEIRIINNVCGSNNCKNYFRVRKVRCSGCR